jgi:hypothetical protein
VRRICLVRRSRGRECGVGQFSQHLTAQFRSAGWSVVECNVFERPSHRAEPNTIIHYVPSMWAGHSAELDSMLAKASAGRVLILMHGIYPPGKLSHRSETPCPDLPNHIGSMARYGAKLIPLSASCEKVCVLWREHYPGLQVIKSIAHPGVYSVATIAPAAIDYIFYGGIFRPKKSTARGAVYSLLNAYAAANIRVWMHVTNEFDGGVSLPVWRETRGLLTDDQWISALANASAVICPYDTEIQCVSGVISESLSLGTRVICTDFLIAQEMRSVYPDHVHIENDLSRWPDLTRGLSRSSLPMIKMPDWPGFVDGLVGELSTVSPGSLPGPM